MSQIFYEYVRHPNIGRSPSSVIAFPYNHRGRSRVPARPLPLLLEVSPTGVCCQTKRDNRRSDGDLDAVGVTRAADDAVVGGRDPAACADWEGCRNGVRRLSRYECRRGRRKGRDGAEGCRDESAVEYGEVVAGVVRVEVAPEHDGEEVPAEEGRE